MAKQVRIIDGMGDYTQGVGADTADFMNYVNNTLSESCVVRNLDFIVEQKGSGADMSVDVGVGDAYILNSSWSAGSVDETKFFAVASDAIINVPIASNSSGNPRIDIIVATVDKVTPPNDEATNVFTVTVLAGTPAGSPNAPSTPANSKKLAEIAVTNGATSIVNANITDTRKFLSLQLYKGRIVLGSENEERENTTEPAIIIEADGYDEVPTGDPLIEIKGSASNNIRTRLTSYGSSNTGYEGIRGRGSLSSPTATQANDRLVGLISQGIDNTGALTGTKGILEIKAAGNQSTTNHGTYLSASLTPENSTTRIDDAIKITADSNSNVTLSPPADGDVIAIGRTPFRVGSTNFYLNRFQQHGVAYIQGDGSLDILTTVTLPVAFSSIDFTVYLTYLGTRAVADGAPTGTFDFDGPLTNDDFCMRHLGDQNTTSSFVIRLDDLSASWSSSFYQGISWLAIGTV